MPPAATGAPLRAGPAKHSAHPRPDPPAADPRPRTASFSTTAPPPHPQPHQPHPPHHQPHPHQQQQGLGAPGGDGGSSSALRRVLGPVDLFLVGIAVIIGAGVFVLTGSAARDYAGPAVTVSFAVAGAAATASALCYSELASEVATTGGAAVYAEQVFGPLAGWLVAANLLLEYTLGSAAVARGFTAYLAALAGLPPDALLLPPGPAAATSSGGGGGGFQVDLVAVGMLVVMAALVGWGVRQAAWVNTAITMVVLLTIFLIMAAGFVFVHPANYHPFAPFGARGVLRGATVVFFAFIGFDMVAVAAEEAKRPSRDVPACILTSLAACTALYVLMAAAITGMAPAATLDPAAPFARAFKAVGQGWAQYVISAGALCSVLDTAVVTLYSAARLLLLLGRRGVLPRCLAAVHPATHTPLRATALATAVTCLLAALAPLELLASLVSLGTLTAFTTVCAAVLWRRCGPPPPLSPPPPSALPYNSAAAVDTWSVSAADGSDPEAPRQQCGGGDSGGGTGRSGGGGGGGGGDRSSNKGGDGDGGGGDGCSKKGGGGDGGDVDGGGSKNGDCGSSKGGGGGGTRLVQPKGNALVDAVEGGGGGGGPPGGGAGSGGGVGGSCGGWWRQRECDGCADAGDGDGSDGCAGGGDGRAGGGDGGGGVKVAAALGVECTRALAPAGPPQLVPSPGSSDLRPHTHSGHPPPHPRSSDASQHGGSPPPPLPLVPVAAAAAVPPMVPVRPLALRCAFLAAILAAGGTTSGLYYGGAPLAAAGAALGAWAVVTAAAAVVLRPTWAPPGFRTPLWPLLPSFGMLLNCVLLGSLGARAWQVWGGAMAAALVWWAWRRRWLAAAAAAVVRRR